MWHSHASLGLGVVLTRRSVAPFSAAVRERERFVAAAAHELRTPMATLSAICESSLAGDEDEARARVRIQAVLGRTHVSLENPLLFARLTRPEGTESVRRTPVRLDLLAELVGSEFQQVEVQTEPTTVEVDDKLFEVATRNLLSNAVRHGCRSRILLRVTPHRIEVRDEGPGFPPEVIDQGARPFAAHGATAGTGLGLSIVDHIARLHGLRLRLRLRNGDSGAIATLELA